MLRSLIPWRKPEESLARYSSPVNRLMDEFFAGLDDPFAFLRADRSWKEFTPALDVTEDENSLIVRAELPGLTEKDVEISVRDDSLVIRGEKKAEKEEKDKDVYRMERTFGRFERRILLPTEVDGTKASATCKDGVLTVTLPKTPKAKAETRKIEIKAG